MPKGVNKDGTKKTRPANSGRKAKPSKKIAPQISLEAFAVLASADNQNKFISEAILEKAERDAAKRATLKETKQTNTGQIDLVNMLQEIHIERVVENIHTSQGSGLATVELKVIAPKNQLSTQIDEIRERILEREERDREDLNEWLAMPAVDTWRDVNRLRKQHSKRKRNSALFIQIKAFRPDMEFKLSWRCWLDVVNEKGKSMGWSHKASRYYVEEIQYSPDWTIVEKPDHTTLFLLPINNPITEKKPTVKKVKPAKAKKLPANSTLADIIGVSDQDELPEWLRQEKPFVDTEPEPEQEQETTNQLQPWAMALTDNYKDDVLNRL